jgi:glycine/D-amino acid oxidase-like deaminating enzyme
VIERCLWLDVLPPRRDPAALPHRTDVVVVGGGYTGLSAARALARHGAAVTVLERHHVGWGASGRNGGFVLPGFQPEPADLVRRHGAARARELYTVSTDAIELLERLIEDEAIDCGYTRCGAVTLAARPSHLRELARSQAALRKNLGHETILLGRAELRQEIGSPLYHGGLLHTAAGSLHPARYCAGLAGAAERAGAVIVEGVELLAVRRSHGALHLTTSAGSTAASEVLVATNGYTGAAFPALRRRVVPVGSYVVATAPLEPGVARELLPRGRVMTDTWHLLHYFRLSEDGRLVFGGRASFTPTSVQRSARILAAALRLVFPRLGPVPIEFAWCGNVAFARDRMPHAGRLDGLHYAMGYAGHGVALSTWLGTRMGDTLAGRSAAPALTGGLPAIPLYGGTPWFLPAVGGYYRLKDWIS